jgi:DNA-binding transcriptional ArsR family regulator
MPSEDLSDGMLELLILENPEAIKLLFSEKYNRILTLLQENELCISDIAKVLDMNAGSVHYHLKELEKYGIVKQVRQEMKRNMARKYYRATARHTTIDPSSIKQAVPGEADPTEDYIENVIGALAGFGFELKPGRLDEAKDAIKRYNIRMKAIMRTIRDVRLPATTDPMVANDAFTISLAMKAFDDPEMMELNRIFLENFKRKKLPTPGPKRQPRSRDR